MYSTYSDKLYIKIMHPKQSSNSGVHVNTANAISLILHKVKNLVHALLLSFLKFRNNLLHSM